MGTGVAIVGGALAGAAGARLLAGVPRGVTVSPCWCAAGVATLWALTSLVEPTPSWWSPVPLALGWLGVLLSAADLVAARLPDALTLPAYPAAALLLVVSSLGAQQPGLLARAVLGTLIWSGTYALLRLAAPTALGGGDVKLAGPLGAVTAAASWPGLLVAMLGAAVLTVAVALPARLLGHRHVPHGPAMLVAAWLVVLA